jgi:hypothetical protein
MVAVFVLSLLGGAWTANGIPHLLNGLVRNPYPCELGNSPGANVVAGSVALSASPAFYLWSDVSAHLVAAWAGTAVGALALFAMHAVLVPRKMTAGAVS